MAYPYDSPAYAMNTIWNSGSYTPDTIVKNIRDDYTPINKNSMRNSVGHQLSLVQNFVNTKYLGRPGLPVNSGYIEFISGYNIQSTWFENPWTTGAVTVDKFYTNQSAQRVYMYVSNAWYGNYATRTLKADSNYTFSKSTDGTEFETWVDNSGFRSICDQGSNYVNSFYASPISGLGHKEHVGYGYQTRYNQYNLNPTGICWYYNDASAPLTDNSVAIMVDPSGGVTQFGSYVRIQPVNEEWDSTRLQNDYFYSLMVLRPTGDYSHGYGDAYIQTHGGYGLMFTGDNGIYSRVLTPSGRLTLGINDGDARMIEFGNTNGSDSWVKVGNCSFAVHDQTPTGQAINVTLPTTGSIGQILDWITGVAYILQNYGFMAS